MSVDKVNYITALRFRKLYSTLPELHNNFNQSISQFLEQREAFKLLRQDNYSVSKQPSIRNGING